MVLAADGSLAGLETLDGGGHIRVDHGRRHGCLLSPLLHRAS
jgi:hypothetical protein